MRRVRKGYRLSPSILGLAEDQGFQNKKQLHNCGIIEEVRETRPVLNGIQWNFKFFNYFFKSVENSKMLSCCLNTGQRHERKVIPKTL